MSEAQRAAQEAGQKAHDERVEAQYRASLQETESALRRPSAADIERIVQEQQKARTAAGGSAKHSLATQAAITRKAKGHGGKKSFSGKCVGVADGDTITVMDECCEEKIRLHGIDAPEKKQAFGNQAKKFTSDLVFGKTVTVYPTDKDRYGRTVAWVFVGKQCVNAQIVKAGSAWHYKQYAPNEAKLATYESEARNAKRGLWSDVHAVAPWDFRRGKTTARPIVKTESVASAHSVVEKDIYDARRKTVVAVALIGAAFLGATLLIRRKKV